MLNKHTRAHTYIPEKLGEQKKINKANCIRSQEIWIPGQAVIKLNYVAMGNFFFLVKNQQRSTKLFLMYFLF